MRQSVNLEKSTEIYKSTSKNAPYI